MLNIHTLQLGKTTKPTIIIFYFLKLGDEGSKVISNKALALSMISINVISIITIICNITMHLNMWSLMLAWIRGKKKNH